ncbi:hypothetical protein SUGI_0109870 [Cryptomeria japonica]|nr:hypothetical protein SUGI_0109870 [Cryptomeria japonica]
MLNPIYTMPALHIRTHFFFSSLRNLEASMSSRSASVLVLLALICASFSDGATAFTRPSGLMLKVTQDSETLQYITEIEQATPLQKKRLVVDIGGDQVWVQC